MPDLISSLLSPQMAANVNSTVKKLYDNSSNASYDKAHNYNHGEGTATLNEEQCSETHKDKGSFKIFNNEGMGIKGKGKSRGESTSYALQMGAHASSTNETETEHAQSNHKAHYEETTVDERLFKPLYELRMAIEKMKLIGEREGQPGYYIPAQIQL